MAEGWLDGITDSMDMNLSKLRETVEERGAVLQSMGSHRVGYDLVTEQQQKPHFNIITSLKILLPNIVIL